MTVAILATAILATAMLVTSAPEAAASPAAVDVAQGWQVHRAGAPSHVVGYTDHAVAQMRERGISRQDVEFVVFLNYADAFRNRQGTWQYKGAGSLVVTMNDAGYVVTAFR